MKAFSGHVFGVSVQLSPRDCERFFQRVDNQMTFSTYLVVDRACLTHSIAKTNS